MLYVAQRSTTLRKHHLRRRRHRCRRQTFNAFFFRRLKFIEKLLCMCIDFVENLHPKHFVKILILEKLTKRDEEEKWPNASSQIKCSQFTNESNKLLRLNLDTEKEIILLLLLIISDMLQT